MTTKPKSAFAIERRGRRREKEKSVRETPLSLSLLSTESSTGLPLGRLVSNWSPTPQNRGSPFNHDRDPLSIDVPITRLRDTKISMREIPRPTFLRRDAVRYWPPISLSLRSTPYTTLIVSVFLTRLLGINLNIYGNFHLKSNHQEIF